MCCSVSFHFFCATMVALELSVVLSFSAFCFSTRRDLMWSKVPCAFSRMLHLPDLSGQIMVLRTIVKSPTFHHTKTIGNSALMELKQPARRAVASNKIINAGQQPSLQTKIRGIDMWHSKILNDVLLAGKSCLVACVPRMSSASHYAWNISICQVVIMIINRMRH